MTTPRSYIRISLADRFAGLRRSGLTPLEAVELLEKQWYAYHFHTADFNLPSDCDWGVDGAGNLTLKLPDGRALDPRKVMTRPPGMLDLVPVPFSQIAALTPNSEQMKVAMLDADAQLGPSPQPVSPQSTPNIVPEAEPIEPTTAAFVDTVPAELMTAMQRRKMIEVWTTSWLMDKQDIEKRTRNHYKAAAKDATEERFGEKISDAGFYRSLQATGRTKYGPKLPPPKNNSRA